MKTEEEKISRQLEDIKDVVYGEAKRGKMGVIQSNPDGDFDVQVGFYAVTPTGKVLYDFLPEFNIDTDSYSTAVELVDGWCA